MSMAIEKASCMDAEAGLEYLKQIGGLEWTFDTAALAYEKWRPGYSDELYEMIFDYISLGKSSNVVEVGIGGGQATLPFLKKGCKLTAVECGERFSEICRRKFKDYPDFKIITNKFELTDFEADTYDLVYSASAFHWVPEKEGYSKVYSMLKNGGAFARFANHPYRAEKNPALSYEMDKIYDAYYYTFHKKKREPLAGYTEQRAKEQAMTAEKYGFTDIRYALFHRVRTFQAREYTALLGTYSDHIVIEESIRNEFFAKIEEAINRYGGTIDIYDTMDIELARKN